MCVLSIKVPIRKKSGNLFDNPRNIYIYIMIFCPVALVFSNLAEEYLYLSRGIKHPQ